MTLYLTDRTPPEEIRQRTRQRLRRRRQALSGGRHDAFRRRRDLDREYLGRARSHGRARSRAAGARRGDRPRGGRVRSRALVHRQRARAHRRARTRAQGRLRAHHDRGGRGVRAHGAAGRRRDDHAAAPADEPQCDLRGRHPPAPLLPARAEARAGPRGAARSRDRRRPALLPRYRQRAARAAHQGSRLRLRGHLLGARGDRVLRRGFRAGGTARPPRGLRLRARRGLLRRAPQPRADHAAQGSMDRAGALPVRRRPDRAAARRRARWPGNWCPRERRARPVGHCEPLPRVPADRGGRRDRRLQLARPTRCSSSRR